MYAKVVARDLIWKTAQQHRGVQIILVCKTAESFAYNGKWVRFYGPNLPFKEWAN